MKFTYREAIRTFLAASPHLETTTCKLRRASDERKKTSRLAKAFDLHAPMDGHFLRHRLRRVVRVRSHFCLRGNAERVHAREAWTCSAAGSLDGPLLAG